MHGRCKVLTRRVMRRTLVKLADAPSTPASLYPMPTQLERPLGPRFSAALAYAADIHRQQPRKGSQVPYIAHILGVTSIALEYGATEDEAIAAVLHDAIEDAPAELGDNAGESVRRWIGYRFGPAVLHVVEACTDADVKPKPAWRLGKETYIAGVAHKTASALLVSAADKLHNSRAILGDVRTSGNEFFNVFNKDAGQNGTMWYYRAIYTAMAARARDLKDSRVSALVEELGRVVGQLEELVNGT